MKPSLKEYFTFNKSERNGILVLVTIIMALLVGVKLIPVLVPERGTDFSEYEKDIQAFLAAQREKDEEPPRYAQNDWKQQPKKEAEPRPAPEYFKFNPNNLPVEDWQRLGLSIKQAQVIHNYEAKGGQFRTKADVAKMYVIDDTTYAHLEPWIDIPPAPPKPEPAWKTEKKSWEKKEYDKPKTEYKKWEPPTLEINSATAEDLELLRGIGPVLAGRIVKYRDALGGFGSIDQLENVYGLKPEVIEQNRKYLTIIPVEPRKVNINTCTVEELRDHCRLRWSVANSIVAYRQLHGDYSDVSEIMNSDLVNAELYAKIAPLLTL